MSDKSAISSQQSAISAMPIKLYNTMSRKLEDFRPLIPGQVGFYSCGPTVYWDQHLGNMRTFISNDIIKRMFAENGYKVTHVMNYTDVGHLVGDEDEDGGEGKEDQGKDKMLKAANRENKSVWEIAQKYIDSVKSDMADLNLIPPTFTPRATDYIAEQIDLIKKLQELGYAYVIPGKGVYYDTAKFADYGALSGKDMSKQLAGFRISDDGKHSPADFVLWAFLPDDAKNEMIWDSPWGRGFPGWHIECSAMSMKLLGNHFDIHTAAQEHINIHHTNEIAQSEPVVGKPWVSYWVHFGWLMGKDAKVSKSAGDTLTVPLLKRRGYDPMAFRYMALLSQYRSPLEFTWESLDAAAAGYKNIVRKVAGLLEPTNYSPLEGESQSASIVSASRDAVGGQSARIPPTGAQKSAPTPPQGGSNYSHWHDRILGAVSDNLKTATALVYVQELLADESVDAATKISLFEFIDRLLGLQFIDRAQKLLAVESAPVPAEIQKLADDRNAAKAAKDWKKADEIRAQIDAAGYIIMDGKDGVKITKK